MRDPTKRNGHPHRGGAPSTAETGHDLECPLCAQELPHVKAYLRINHIMLQYEYT